jgi:hypothetical protein
MAKKKKTVDIVQPMGPRKKPKKAQITKTKYKLKIHGYQKLYEFTSKNYCGFILFVRFRAWGTPAWTYRHLHSACETFPKDFQDDTNLDRSHAYSEIIGMLDGLGLTADLLEIQQLSSEDWVLKEQPLPKLF